MMTSNFILKGIPLDTGNPFFIFLLLLFIIYIFVNKDLTNDKIENFCRKKGWKIISKDPHMSWSRSWSWGWNYNRHASHYDVKYYDRNDKLHNVVLKLLNGEVTIEENEIIDVAELEPILEIKVAEVGFTQMKYKVAEGELIIEQQYHNPNLGEKVFLNGKTAPNGKYKIGRFQTLEILNGIVINTNSE